MWKERAKKRINRIKRTTQKEEREREKRRKKAQAKAEFDNKIAFIANRIRICHIKKLGKHHHYYSAKAKQDNELEVLTKRGQDNARKKKGREIKEKEEEEMDINV